MLVPRFGTIKNLKTLKTKLKTLKTSTSLNNFKHNMKKHYFNELKKKES